MAGTDVLQKCIAANQIKNGSLVAFVLPNGVSIIDNTYVKTNANLDHVENKLTDRFDDKTYYTT